MRRLLRNALALLLAAFMLAAIAVAPAGAEDWRDLLRDAFGLGGDSQSSYSEPDAGGEEDAAPARADEWETPITDAQQIVNYLEAYGELPYNFITKQEAKRLGWDSRYNYVGDVAPGMSIGGDRFGNYEGALPSQKGRTWYECDVQYKGKKRGAKRLLFSSDGLYYYTDDHYQTFTQMFPEDRR